MIKVAFSFQNAGESRKQYLSHSAQQCITKLQWLVHADSTACAVRDQIKFVFVHFNFSLVSHMCVRVDWRSSMSSSCSRSATCEVCIERWHRLCTLMENSDFYWVFPSRAPLLHQHESLELDFGGNTPVKAPMLARIHQSFWDITAPQCEMGDIDNVASRQQCSLVLIEFMNNAFFDMMHIGCIMEHFRFGHFTCTTMLICFLWHI